MSASKVLTVGVLGLQGDFREHLRVLARLGVSARDVRKPGDLDGLDGLILPGGESTTIARLLKESGLWDEIRERGQNGLPLYGTCAGLILLAKEILEGRPEGLGLLDITVDRNAYGRQVDSFEADLEIQGIGPFHAVFIRAPKVIRWGPDVEVLAEYDDSPVLLRQDHILGSSFHPELTDDTRIHEYFLQLVREQ
jgi:5'-phosphate synthase pdxT subunit